MAKTIVWDRGGRVGGGWGEGTWGQASNVSSVLYTLRRRKKVNGLGLFDMLNILNLTYILHKKLVKTFHAAFPLKKTLL